MSHLSHTSQTDWQRLQNVALCYCRSGTRGYWDLSRCPKRRHMSPKKTLLAVQRRCEGPIVSVEPHYLPFMLCDNLRECFQYPAELHQPNQTVIVTVMRAYCGPVITASLLAAGARRPLVQRRCACGARSSHRLPCQACSRGAVGATLRAPGMALDADTRTRFEQHFGHDFGRIRVHADAEGAAAAQSVAADAFTVGRHIVFARDRYAPHTGGGRDLLAHELAHAVQQGQAEAPDPAGLRVSRPGDAAEHAADRAAAGLAPTGRANAAIQRQPEPQPNVGPPVSEVPRPPICSLVYEDGRLYWKCENLPKIGSTPKIPLDPRDI